MGSEIESGLEEKLKSLLEQLQAECGVRRDLRLLQSAKLDELVVSCFHVITGRKPKQKMYLLESLKWSKSASGVPNFMERLVGAARLLSQVSVLLARSFFMEFSLAVLALLARLRVLVQQILLDVVSLSNTVSSISQNKQSVKINQKGIEVFREYYPSNKEFISLECVWKVDKFVLLERVHKSDVKEDEQSIREPNDGRKAIRYRSIQAFLRAIDDDDEDVEKMEEDQPKIECSSLMEKGEDLTVIPSTSNENEHQDCIQMRDVQQVGESPEKGGHLNATLSSSSDAKPSPPNLNSRQVAFVSVKRPVPTTAAAFISVKRPATSTYNVTTLGHSRDSEKEPEGKEDSFFNLLTSGGNVNNSLF
ncbi:hypothetical protein LINPERPRIM_LOCUS5482 [Linum perenne]